MRALAGKTASPTGGCLDRFVARVDLLRPRGADVDLVALPVDLRLLCPGPCHVDLVGSSPDAGVHLLRSRRGGCRGFLWRVGGRGRGAADAHARVALRLREEEGTCVWV